MDLMELIFHAVMAGSVIGLLVLLHHKPRRLFLVLALLVLAIGLLALVLGRGIFGSFNYLALGAAIYGTALLTGAAVVLWRRHHRWPALACAALALLDAGASVDAFFIEPTWLEVSRVQIQSPKLRRKLKVALVADFQTDRIGPYERLVLSRLAEERADLILLAGDYLQVSTDRWVELSKQFRREWRRSKIKAPLGIFAVQGNVDPPQWTELFRGLKVSTARRTRSFTIRDELQLTCLGAEDSYNPELRVSAAAGGRFHLVLGHAPDYALGEIAADLLMAGHTHGGQVQIPLLGPLVTLSSVPARWAAGGVVDLPQAGGARLVVSRGIGHERGKAPRIRLFCRPQLVIIELSPSRSPSRPDPG